MPLGVLAVIFEARPDAVTQIASLALKTGNAAILKPGREVEHTATLLISLLREALAKVDVPQDAVSLVLGREQVRDLLAAHDLIDMVIPRGSKQLVEFVQRNTRIPVLGHSEGVCHIHRHGSAHTESILTEDPVAAERFLREVDAAGVFHNVSTRFADGFRYGFGAEVGVSTGKLHARGPVGLEGLTTYKYLLRGHGHIAADYRGPHARAFTHRQSGQRAAVEAVSRKE